MSSHKRPRTDDRPASSYSRSSSTAAVKPRLTRACAECKKHKIKCFVQPGRESCNKCIRSGVECVPHNFARKFMDEDAAWKAHTTATIDRLDNAVEQLLRQRNPPALSDIPGLSATCQGSRGHPESLVRAQVQPLSPLSTARGEGSSTNFTPEGPTVGHDESQDDTDLVPLPMNNLYNLTDPNNSQLIRVDPAGVNGPDFITQGTLPLSEAEFLFDHYRVHINPLLWEGMLCSHRTLQEARQSSSLLVAVVLTVAALHIPHREQSLHATYGAFVSLMRGSCLLRCQNLDVIRALCIGAFYLTSLSWALCSRAVRVATEMNLHKSSLQFARGSLESYERVRLWYVLYVCDHQFALAYGRPPMMHEDASIRNAEKLLTSGLSSKGDHGLVAQVKLFRILASGYFMHGCDPDLELDGDDFERLKEFNISVDQWRLDHQPKSKDLNTTTDPPTVNALYYHLARFQLNSVSLRGISARESSSELDLNLGLDMGWERQEAANLAITAAMSTARHIVATADLQRALIELPIFVHAMIAVCASFLLKMAVVFGKSGHGDSRTIHLPRDLAGYGLNFHTKTALNSVQDLVGVLSLVADNASQRHVVRQVVTGLRDLLQRFSSGHDDGSFLYTSPLIKVQPPPPVTRSNRRGACSGGTTQASLIHTSGSGIDYYPPHIADNVSSGVVQADGGRQQDPFDLTGDLDWRFDDGFLFGIELIDSELAFL
ncbi:Zn(II)2Cys6 transcription factor [Aspergillus stella-maris]|uniref:Zn(II)2Cys6 transcription factor n=1 Tax=Aspergillus stella-maris TaxID=1810926 RepID=UPI003CCDDE75